MFADLSGRRRRQMKFAGIAVGGVLLACVAVMAVGLLGGPRAPFIPGGTRNGASAPARPGTDGSPGGASASPSMPTPGVLPRPQASGSGHAAAASATVDTSPSPTNAGGKTPRGHNRSPFPQPALKHTSAP